MDTSHMPYLGLLITLAIGGLFGAFVSTSNMYRTRKEKLGTLLFHGAVSSFVIAFLAHSLANSTGLGWEKQKTTQMRNVTISVLSKDEVAVVSADKSALTAKVDGSWLESGDYNEITVVRHEPSMFGYLYGLKPWTEVLER